MIFEILNTEILSGDDVGGQIVLTFSHCIVLLNTSTVHIVDATDVTLDSTVIFTFIIRLPSGILVEFRRAINIAGEFTFELNDPPLA